MTWQAWATLTVVLVMIVGLVKETFTADLVLLGALVSLLLLGIVSPSEALQGFSNPALVTVVAMVLIAQALYATGAIDGLARRVFGKSSSESAALVRMMLAVLVMSAFLNNTPIVAMFIPLVISWCRKSGVAPTRLLIPLSYASLLGGVCTLIGTSTNLVVSGLMHERGMEEMRMWDLTPIGLPVALAGTLFMVLIGRHLLPGFKEGEARDNSGERRYQTVMRIELASILVASRVERLLQSLPAGVSLMAVERAEGQVLEPSPELALHTADRLHFLGPFPAILELQQVSGLALDTEPGSPRLSHRQELYEAVLSEASPTTGFPLPDANFRSRYDATLVGIHRTGEMLEGSASRWTLHAGDILLVAAQPGFRQLWRNARDFFLTSAVEEGRPPRAHLAWLSLAILFAVVGLSTLEILPIVIASLAGSVACIVSGSLTREEAKQSVDPAMLMVIGASFGIAAAIEKTGLAGVIAGGLVDAGTPFGPAGILTAVFLATVLLTELLSNNAAAALMFPIAISASSSAGIAPEKFCLVVAVAASCSFVLPMGYQTNMMVYGAGDYSVRDFIRVGVPLQVVACTTAIAALLLWG